jgi:hypothetical protein
MSKPLTIEFVLNAQKALGLDPDAQAALTAKRQHFSDVPLFLNTDLQTRFLPIGGALLIPPLWLMTRQVVC